MRWTRRTRWLVLLIALGLPVAGAVGWSALAYRRGRQAQQALVEALAGLSADHQRRAHVPSPDPGSFGEALPEGLRGIERAIEAMSEQAWSTCEQVARGERAVPDADPACRRAADDAVDRLLVATHRREAGLPPGMGMLLDPGDPLAEGGWLLAMRGAVLALFDVRIWAAEDDVDRALLRCVDVVALARDYGIGSPLLGSMVSAKVLSTAAPVCIEVADSASAVAKSEAIRALQLIAAQERPFSEVLRNESIYGQLLAFGRQLTPEQLDALDPAVRRVVETSSLESPSVLAPLTWDAWASYHDFMERTIAAAELPVPDAMARMEQLGHDLDDELNPIVRMLAPGLGQYLEPHHLGRCHLDLLRASLEADMYRSRHGRWPTADALSSSRTAMDATLELRTVGEQLELVVTPAVAEDDAEALAARLRPDPPADGSPPPR